MISIYLWEGKTTSCLRILVPVPVKLPQIHQSTSWPSFEHVWYSAPYWLSHCLLCSKLKSHGAFSESVAAHCHRSETDSAAFLASWRHRRLFVALFAWWRFGFPGKKIARQPFLMKMFQNALVLRYPSAIQVQSKCNPIIDTVFLTSQGETAQSTILCTPRGASFLFFR